MNLLDIMVNASNSNELSENIRNEDLIMFISPLSASDITKLCQSTSESPDDLTEQKEAEQQINPVNNNNNNPCDSVKSVVSENVRILKKSPSFCHDKLSQMSIKVVTEILEKTTDDKDILKNLDSYQLGYFAKAEKTEFWEKREESMNRIVMETLDEDEDELESKSENSIAIKESNNQTKSDSDQRCDNENDELDSKENKPNFVITTTESSCSDIKIEGYDGENDNDEKRRSMIKDNPDVIVFVGKDIENDS